MMFAQLSLTVRAFLGRLRRDRRGNVLMLVGLSVIPMMVATGMSIDYARAARLRTKLDAAADAAALSAVTQTAMTLSDADAATNALSLFNGAVSTLPGLVYDPSQVSAAYTPQPQGVTNIREITITYDAASTNVFGGILGMATIPIHGTAKAKSAVSPNIDFFLMLDTSPSMLLPATSDGLTAQIAATNGCAFACHQTDLDPTHSSEVVCQTNSQGQKVNCIDYYTVARNNNIVLRTDLLTQAVQNLTDVATSTAQQNGATYRMGIADFDYLYRQIWPTVLPTDGRWVDANLSNVKAHVSDAQVLSYCVNNSRICGTGDNDQATNFTAAFTGALSTMPTSPGNGTSAPGDTPQAMLFIITDGMRDESSGGRQIGPIPTSQCTTIKNRGIRIAILYTEYLPAAASDGWSITNVRNPYLSPTDKISPALVSCASPGLYYMVTTNGDISTALANLFAKAVQSARLTG